MKLSNIAMMTASLAGVNMSAPVRKHGRGPYSVSALEQHPGSALHQTGRTLNGGSRWMPHIGAKQRAKTAHRPDGPMHVTGHQRRAGLLEELKVAA